jgi:hypothetical protein
VDSSDIESWFGEEELERCAQCGRRTFLLGATHGLKICLTCDLVFETGSPEVDDGPTHPDIDETCGDLPEPTGVEPLAGPRLDVGRLRPRRRKRRVARV